MSRDNPTEQIVAAIFHANRAKRKREKKPKGSAEFPRPRDEKWWK